MATRTRGCQQGRRQIIVTLPTDVVAVSRAWQWWCLIQQLFLEQRWQQSARDRAEQCSVKERNQIRRQACHKKKSLTWNFWMTETQMMGGRCQQIWLTSRCPCSAFCTITKWTTTGTKGSKSTDNWSDYVNNKPIPPPQQFCFTHKILFLIVGD